MQTKRITITENTDAELQSAAEIIKNGGLVAFPTETVYGLGANGLDAAAAAGIYAAKGRPSDNPLILHVADFATVDRLARDVNEAARLLMRAYFPGPLTLILRRRKIVPDRITGGLDTVGIRMPENETARRLIRLSGVPIAAPSANTSGRPSPTTADAVLDDLDGRIDMVVDGGPCGFGVESTIVDCTEEPPVILRPGAVTREMLAVTLGDVRLDPALAGHTDLAPKAPGMKYKHYAPKAPLVLLEGPGEKMADGMRREIAVARASGQRVGVLVSEETKAALPTDLVAFVYGRRGDTRAAAMHLYAALRAFDRQDVDIIFAEGTPSAGVGLAVMNRMYKAAGYKVVKL